MKLNPTTLASSILLIVLILDFIAPLGIAVGILYLFCFLIVCGESKKTIIAFAVITSILTVTKIIVFFSPEINYFVYTNRCITFGIIWIVATLAIRHRTLAEQLTSERNTYTKELEQMLFMTSHEVRKPIASCLGLMNLVENGKPLSQEELWKIIKHLKLSALELDAFTKQLTTFIHEMRQKKEITK